VIGAGNWVLPPSPLHEAFDFKPSLSASITFKWPQGKKGRKFKRQLHELGLSKIGQTYARLYRSVKQHQLRKRQLNKSR
jgi:hypothetical protein